MNKLKTGVGIGTLLIIIWVIFALIDMWFDIVSVGVFIKVSISMCAVFLLVILLGFFYTKHDD